MNASWLKVREHNGVVELVIEVPDLEETTIVLDGQTARKLGDELFKAGANCGL